MEAQGRPSSQHACIRVKLYSNYTCREQEFKYKELDIQVRGKWQWAHWFHWRKASYSRRWRRGRLCEERGCHTLLPHRQRLTVGRPSAKPTAPRTCSGPAASVHAAQRALARWACVANGSAEIRRKNPDTRRARARHCGQPSPSNLHPPVTRPCHFLRTAAPRHGPPRRIGFTQTGVPPEDVYLSVSCTHSAPPQS